MNLYRIDYSDGTLARVQWEGTQAAARKAQRDLEQVHGRVNVDDFKPVEVPTDKPGLLDWLNEHASGLVSTL
jgi:hypothetical protein